MCNAGFLWNLSSFQITSVAIKMATITKKKKYSKKSKKNWRKHTDIKDIEEFLDEQRLEERTGGPVAEKPDSGLFFVDKVQKPSEPETSLPQKSRKRKILKRDELLLPDPRIKPVGSKKFKKNKKNKDKNSHDNVSDDDDDSEDEKWKYNNNVPTSKPKEIPASKEKYDLWATEEKPIGDEHFLRTTRNSKIKIPKTAKRTITELSAVEVCEPGASYNPTYEEHQELLRKAHEKEEKKVKEIEKVNRKVQWLSKEDAANLPTWEEEMSQGLFADEKDDNENNSSDEEQTEDYVKSVKTTDRKTKQRKRKQKQEKEQQKEQDTEKSSKLHENEIYRIKSIKKEIEMKEKKIEEKKKRKDKLKETELTRTKRLGRHAFEEPSIEIQLSSEITGNLRSLKPEGNVVTDRFKSLQKRNIIESRKRVIPHRRYALKEYEKRSYKQPCIKEINTKGSKI